MTSRRQRSRAPVGLDDAVVGDLQDRLLSWYREHRRDLPWRNTRDAYAVLVSEVMLQQTQVTRVIPKYEAWLARFPDLETLAAAPLGDVLVAWQGLGYNNRARRLRDCAAAVTDGSGGSPARLPIELAELLALPGIGPYTARAILVFAHNRDMAAVDTNVRRVLLHELELPIDTGGAALQGVAEAVLPRGSSRDWHNALMDYGAMVITARAAGGGSKRRQTPFVGSRRWQRARLLRLVLNDRHLGIADLAAALDLPPAEVELLVEQLQTDGLLRSDAGVVGIA